MRIHGNLVCFVFDSNPWMKSDGANDSMFNAGWKADRITHSQGVMTIKLNNQPSHEKPYTSGELQSNDLYGYGKYEVVMKTAKQESIVNSFFTYNGSPLYVQYCCANKLQVRIFNEDGYP